MKILVLAHEKDDHAAPIVWALERAGYQAACWAGVSWTEQEQVSLLFGEHSRMVLGTTTLEAGDRVWLRQPDEPDPPGADRADPAESGGASLFDAIAYMLETQPVSCINKFSASRMIVNKPVQLQLAAESGLKVPATLVSNSPRATRDFFDQHPSHAVCKAFSPHVWRQSSGGIAMNKTFQLRRDELPAADDVFTYAPAIYQQMVRKQFDVRTVLLGHRIYSFALSSSKSALDWRFPAALGDIHVESIGTPKDVESRILAFAQKAGICFGSLDFAVDANGEWWFLEINEQGQFLWLEHFCPEARLQQKFCAFITAPESSTQPLEERQGLFPSLPEYEQLQKKRDVLKLGSPFSGPLYSSIEP